MCMRMWCIGKIIKKVTHGLTNFSAKFEIDEASSLLTLNSADYDISPDADYNAWMILEGTRTTIFGSAMPTSSPVMAA